ncbi:MAG: hypothetical protein AAFU61_05375 [Pseudomonadota bacterium]
MLDNIISLDGRAFPAARLPARERILEAAVSEDGEAARKLAEAHADDLLQSDVARAERNVEAAERELADAAAERVAVRAERGRIQQWRHAMDARPQPGKGQPGWQRLYNALKCLVAALAPLMGGGYLMANMMDNSFTLSQAPWLAVLASGPIALASFALSSWAILPEDAREVERRATRLLMFSALAFVAWSAAIAVRFGAAPPAPETLGAGFDPTASASALGGAADRLLGWAEVNGVVVAGLFLHLLAEALLSAGCVASAICSSRKVLVVESHRTSQEVQLRQEEVAAGRRQAEAEGALREALGRRGEALARRKTVFETTHQAVMAERMQLAVEEERAVAAVRAGFRK